MATSNIGIYITDIWSEVQRIPSVGDFVFLAVLPVSCRGAGKTLVPFAIIKVFAQNPAGWHCHHFTASWGFLYLSLGDFSKHEENNFECMWHLYIMSQFLAKFLTVSVAVIATNFYADFQHQLKWFINLRVWTEPHFSGSRCLPTHFHGAVKIECNK